ncbi:protein spire homolog 1-like isoform X2 [Hemicordylus capensis]|uniref:protein spire homolog 1-like isoform X2 n=1 Tax=Hemicordylus capensis TaxID=884348 RepID=UPI0023020E51|nr:protein spire homolog 1-like isoform X2 [Hemicordylus capensis]
MMYTKELMKISLAEFLRYYEQPISEEQAWAICFQCCCKMKQIVAQDSALQMIVLDVDNVYIHSDGSVSFTIKHNSDDSHTNQQPPPPSDWLEDKLTELLGKLIYKALDWGIESHMERELSESLEKLICLMLKLNIETVKPAVSFQDVIKICEDHFLKPSEAASHYTVICRVLFAEYIELQKLMFTIQSCKEYLGRMDVKEDSRRQKPDNRDLGRMDMKEDSQRQKPNNRAGLWQDVLGDLQKGVRLHKPRAPPEKCTRYPYNTVVDDIKNKRYALRKVSAREVKERVCQEPSLHERLMMEVKNPPKLRPTFTGKSRINHKNSQKFSMNNIFSDQNISMDTSKTKKRRLNCIQSDPEIKLLSNCNQMPTRWSLPTIADLMRTQYAEYITEMKDSCQKASCSISSRTQVCAFCQNQFFIWPYLCHLCSSVICKDCCIKMSMPVRPCIRLPLNFFKVVKLSKEDNLVPQDQKTAQLLYEVEHWDSSRVPLVFEPHRLSLPLACRAKIMTDWPSVDICNKCEQYLLEIISHQPPSRKRPLSWTEME